MDPIKIFNNRSRYTSSIEIELYQFQGAKRETCADNFFNFAFSQKLSWVDSKSWFKSTLDRATGLVSFLRSLKEESCSGRITNKTASKLLKATGITAINSALGVGAVKFAALSFANANIALGLTGALAIGLVGLVLTKPTVEKGVEKLEQFFKDLSNSISDYTRR